MRLRPWRALRGTKTNSIEQTIHTANESDCCFTVELVIEGMNEEIVADITMTNVSSKSLSISPEYLGISALPKNLFRIREASSNRRYKNDVKFKYLQTHNAQYEKGQDGYLILPANQSVFVKFYLNDLYEFDCDKDYMVFSSISAYGEKWRELYMSESNEVPLRLENFCSKKWDKEKNKKGGQ